MHSHVRMDTVLVQTLSKVHVHVLPTAAALSHLLSLALQVIHSQEKTTPIWVSAATLVFTTIVLPPLALPLLLLLLPVVFALIASMVPTLAPPFPPAYPVHPFTITMATNSISVSVTHRSSTAPATEQLITTPS